MTVHLSASEQPAIDEFIFGDSVLHAQFSIAIELLARLVIAAPCAMTTSTLAAALGQPSRSIRPLLIRFSEAGLIHVHPKAKDSWAGSATLSAITLADIFRCISMPAPDTARPCKNITKPNDAETPHQITHQSIELLLMQATMCINQAVLQHLQVFDLGRLKAVASRAPFRPPHSNGSAYIAEPSESGATQQFIAATAITD